MNAEPRWEPALWKAVGNTPLLPIVLEAGRGGQVLLKAEWLNPGGSVKDRAARSILNDRADNVGLSDQIAQLISASEDRPIFS